MHYLLRLLSTAQTSKFHGSSASSSICSLVRGAWRGRSSPVGLPVAATTTATVLAGSAGVTTTAHTTTSGSRAGLLLLQCGRYDLSRQVEVVSEVLDALIGEAPVIMPPGKVLLNKSSGLEGLHGLHHMQVGDGGQLSVLGQEEVLLTHNDSLFE